MMYNGKEIELPEMVEVMEEGSSRPYNIRHRAYYFSRDIIRFAGEADHDRMFASLFEQLLRSATSIGANVVESVAGSSKRDFLNFSRIALKSANETKYWLCLIHDTMSVDKAKVAALIREADELSKIIASIIINTLKVDGKGVGQDL